MTALTRRFCIPESSKKPSFISFGETAPALHTAGVQRAGIALGRLYAAAGVRSWHSFQSVLNICNDLKNAQVLSPSHVTRDLL